MKRWKNHSGLILMCAGGVFLALAVNGGWRAVWISGVSIAYLWLCGWSVSRRVFRHSCVTSFLLGPLTAALVIIIVGTPLYFLFGLTDWVISSVMIACAVSGISASIFSSVPAHSRQTPEDQETLPFRSVFLKWTLFFLGGFFFCASTALLVSAQTDRSVLGPWGTVPDLFFALLFLEYASWFSTMILFGRRTSLLTIVGLISVQGGTLLTLVFPLGFGFDPFIHQAAERTIAAHGVITPRTLYYTGQYVLVVTLSKLLPLSIQSLDRLLLPLLVSLSLPIIAIQRLSATGVVISLFALLPVIASPTPWGFAVFLFLLSIMCSIDVQGGHDKTFRPLFPLILAISSFFIHPIAGIPAIALVCVRTLLANNQRALAAIAGTLSAACVPLAFFTNSMISSSFPIALKSPFRETPFYLKESIFSIPWHFDAFLDPVYFFAHNAGSLIALLSIIGISILWKRGARISSVFSVGASAILFVNFMLVDRFLSFPELISYEQNAFGERLLTLSAIVLVPLIGVSLNTGVRRLMSPKTPGLIRAAALFLLAFAGTGALYLSFPRNDAHASFHGYNVSTDDIAAVRWIRERAGGDSYIVLSNQVVSAASVREFGFLRYYSANIEGKKQTLYTYPIPTSSPLYSFFLDMMRKPDAGVIADAMDLARVKKGFFVVNRYEPRGPIIMKAAQETTGLWKSFGQSTVMVFEYRQ